MPKLLAIDWDRQQLRFIVANRHGGRTSIEEVNSISLAAESTDGTPVDSDAAFESRLNAALSTITASARGAETMVAVPRANVELRYIKLPPVPADELPDMVRLQSLREFSELSEDWPLDFLPLQSTADETQVLAAAIAPKRLESYVERLNQHEMKARTMALRPTATAALVSQLEGDTLSHVELCIEDLGHAFELSILRDGTPVLIRTVHAAHGELRQRVDNIADEIKRTTIAARDQLAGESIERIVMFGASVDDQEAGKLLERATDLPVRLFDPFDVLPLARRIDLSTISNAGQFAAAIGMLASYEAETSKLIDFINPRKAPPPKSSQPTLIASALVVSLVALIAAGAFVWHLRSLDAQQRALQLEIQGRRQLLAAAQERLDELKAVQRWQNRRVNWLDIMGDVSDKLPPTESARIDRWQSMLLSDGSGQLILEGVVDDQETIAAVDDALMGEGRKVENSGGNFDDRVADLPWRFKHTVKVETPLTARTPGPSNGARRANIRRPGQPTR